MSVNVFIAVGPVILFYFGCYKTLLLMLFVIIVLWIIPPDSWIVKYTGLVSPYNPLDRSTHRYASTRFIFPHELIFPDKTIDEGYIFSCIPHGVAPLGISSYAVFNGFSEIRLYGG
eukprot:UN13197